ncbi:MAG TPA: hypothetical protein VGR81_01605 [Candidatus Acidoferrales bacterium]|nr:hypothetical protein [Candidatus Acidoferrales bacterium]
MTKKTKFEAFILAALLVILLAVVYYSVRSRDDGFGGVQANDAKFEPLAVPDPSLRLDLLQNIQKQQYNGAHRNIFSAEPLPALAPTPQQVKTQQAAAAAQAAAAVPAAPPPLIVPATFYGIVTDLATGRRKACFSANQDDVYILPEGGTLLNQFRVLKINNNSVDLQDISSGRQTTLTLRDVNSAQGMPPPRSRL